MTTSSVLDFSLRPDLTAEEAKAIFAEGEEAVVLALLQMAAQWRKALGQCASVSSPATPSGMKPIHQKPNTLWRRKKPGRKAGHEGSRRPPPEVTHEHKQHRVSPRGQAHFSAVRRIPSITQTRPRNEPVPDLWAQGDRHIFRPSDVSRA